MYYSQVVRAETTNDGQGFNLAAVADGCGWPLAQFTEILAGTKYAAANATLTRNERSVPPFSGL
jgi:hypothetical protein